MSYFQRPLHVLRCFVEVLLAFFRSILAIYFGLNVSAQSAFLVAKCCSCPVKSNLIRIDPFFLLLVPTAWVQGSPLTAEVYELIDYPAKVSFNYDVDIILPFLDHLKVS